MPQQRVKNSRPRLADFPAIRIAAMQDFQAVRLDLEKRFVAREFFRRGGVGRKGQAHLGGGLDFFEQVLHGRKS